MDIAICSCCGGPVIFRNWPGNPHQPFHLGSGWPCWRLQQDGVCGDPESLPFPWDTPDTVRLPQLERLKALYRRYERTGRMQEVLDAVAAELAANRSEVVRDLIEYLAEEVTDQPRRRALVQQIVASDGWQTLVARLQRSAAARRPRRRAGRR